MLKSIFGLLKVFTHFIYIIPKVSNTSPPNCSQVPNQQPTSVIKIDMQSFWAKYLYFQNIIFNANFLFD